MSTDHPTEPPEQSPSPNLPPPAGQPIGSGGGEELVAAGSPSERKTDEERRAILAQQLQSAAVRGRRVESQSEYQATLVEGQKVNHTLHLIITLVTCGIWGLVWLVIALTGGEKRELLVVDEWGNVQLQRIGKA